MQKTLLHLGLGLTALIAATAPLTAHAQSGGKTLSIVVPQPAGNPTDGVARKLQPLLQKELGQTVVVDNVPGAGGSIGTQKVLNGPADGSLLLIVSQTEPILTPFTLKHVKYKPSDFRAIALVSRLPYILAGRANLPAQNVQELVSQGKKAGSAGWNFGNIGPGSMIHLLGEQFSRKSGVALNQVGYKGVPPVVQDLMGGQIDLTFLPLGGTTLSTIESGKIKAFGTTGQVASTKLPNVPPLSGIDKSLSEFVYGTWIAVLVPVNTPDATAVRLNKAFVEALKDTDFQTYVTSTGMELANSNSMAYLNQFYAKESALYRGLAKSIGVEAN